MSAIEPLASHVAILLEGRLAAFGTVDELRAEHGNVESLEFIYHQIARRERVTEEVFA
jgi:ABC-type multidrug transport system ATPase subunit